MRSNEKWHALSNNLIAADWPMAFITPRCLESMYHSGKAVLRETEEEVGDREIYAFAALRLSVDASYYEAWFWFRDYCDMRQHFGLLMLDLARKVTPGSSVSFEKVGYGNCTYRQWPRRIRVEHNGIFLEEANC